MTLTAVLDLSSVRISERCTACGNCIITCGPLALLPAANKPQVVDQRCNGCGECIEVCPVGAITEVDQRTVDVRTDEPTWPVSGQTP